MKVTKKKMSDRKLVCYLMQCKHLELISINRKLIVCTCGPKFLPEEVKTIMEETGYTDVKLMVDDGSNYLLFNRV